ncbi:Lipase class 3 [Penicillium argentinense]|uniref:Lipase class 3 n=1 Tax=Penicillium argentinense TaxID=1131581 RepID=A0A9W9K1T5_9EURO|nr:Lipase class 3 [Penicillium argentinense]KAJ5088997.1 Lipase class 3 [Penicillium argentinense]
MRFSLIGTVFAAVLVAAAPARPVPRDVSSDVLDQLTLFAQYSAASYCSNNINSTGDSVTCADGNCPSVQSAGATSLYEFEESTQWGDVAGFLAVDDTNQLLVLSFRGSRSASTWIANLDYGLTDVSDLCDECEAHGGFWKAWNVVADDLISQINTARESYDGYTLVLTGHSFGGAVAALGGTALRNAGYDLDLYTYGQPRVGNEALATYMTDQGSLWRATHNDDVVPKLPPISFGFSHASPEYWITSSNNETVSTSDIEEIDGINSRDGNAGTVNPDIEAHNWYISPRRRNRIKAILLTIFIVFALYFLFFAGSEPKAKAISTDKARYAPPGVATPGLRPDTHRDTSSKSTGEQARPIVRPHKEMVVASMKRDDTSWLPDYFPDWSQSIYVVDDTSAPLTVAKNKGRESMVYLTYIIDHYDNLPDAMLFIHSQRFQWHNDDPYYDGVSMLRNFQVPYLQKKGYVNLRCVWTLGCPAEIHPKSDTHRNDVHAGEYFKDGFMQLFPGVPVPDEVGASCCAQFGVSREKVLERPKSDYVRFREWLAATDLTDDLSGRIMEYSWHMIFGEKAVYCPTAKECYCNVFGLCDLDCPVDGQCDGRYVLPPYSSLPKGWPYIGWKGQAQNPSYGLPES